jgi:plasmid stability protein
MNNKSYVITLDQETHKLLRVRAAELGIRIKDAAAQAVLAWIGKKKKGC